jgi:hypothetical protein
VRVLNEVVASNSIVEVPNPTAGQPAMRVAIEAAPGATGQAAIAGSAGTLATNMMGTGGAAAPAGGATPAAAGTPGPARVYPSGTIMAQIQSVAQGWQTAGASLGSLGDEGEIRRRFMEAAVAGIETNPPSAATSAGGIYQRMYQVVRSSAEAAAIGTVIELFAQAIRPTLQAQVAQLLSWVEEETRRHTTAAGTGTNASPNTPADPALLAAVQQIEQNMRQQLQSAQTPGATGSEEPAVGSTDQPVRYSVQGLMGDNNTGGAGVRADMMGGTDTISGVVQQFNANLKRPNEQDFVSRKA